MTPPREENPESFTPRVAVAPSRTLVSVVAPVFNEQDALAEFVRRLIAMAQRLSEKYDWEFVLVDDGSRDRSVEIATAFAADDSRIRVVELRRNYGQTAALQACFDQARGDIIVSMDSDLQHFPEDIPKLIEGIEAGNDVVCGWRHERREDKARRWPSLIANKILRMISGLDIHDIGTTFRAYRREIVQDMRLLGENHRFVPIFAKMVGARIAEVPIENIERPHGRSNYGLSRTTNVFIDLALLFFLTRYLDRPLRAFGKMALVLFAAATTIAFVLGYVWIETGRPVVRDHSGWFIVATLFYLASFQLILTGTIAEIIVRIYFSQDQRKSYQIRRIWERGQPVVP